MVGAGFYDQNSRQVIRWNAAHSGTALSMTVNTNDSSTPRYDYGDGFATASTVVDGRFFNNGLASSSTVTLYTSRLDQIREFIYQPTFGEGVLNRLDISACTGLNSQVTIGNHAMTALTFPLSTVSTLDISVFRVNNNANITRLDLSGMTNIGRTSPNIGTFQVIGNTSITALTLPPTTKLCGLNYRSSTSLLSIDFTPMLAIKGIAGHDCSSLTSITFANSAQTEVIVGDMWFYNNFNLLELDFTRLGDKFGYGGTGLLIDNMTSLTAITFPKSNNSMTGAFQVKNLNVASDYILDFSPLSGMSGTFFDTGENAADSVIFPRTEGEFTSFIRATSFSNVRHIDFSTFSGINCSVIAIQNPSLTGVTFGVYNNPSYVYNGVFLRDNDLRDLDLSNITGLTLAIQFYGNANLTAATMPVTSNSISTFEGYNCNLQTLDLTPLQNLNTSVNFSSNSNLTAVTFTSTTGTLTSMQGHFCDLRDIDFSLLANGFAGAFSFQSNSNLTAVTLPSTTSTVSSLDFSSCDLGKVELGAISGANQSGIFINLNNNSHTAAECNQMLGILNATGWNNGTLWLSGTAGSSTTAVGFDTTSGGEDGWAHFQALTGNGWNILMSGLTV